MIIDLFKIGNYRMYQFSPHHKNALIISIIISIILFLIPMFFKNKKKISIYIGIFIILVKIFDIYYRIEIERFPFYENLPLHICNVLIILSGLYLITKNNIFYNILYYFIYAPIVVLIIPGYFMYKTPFYIVLFMLTHMLILDVVIYGKIYLKAKLNKKGLYYSILTYFILLVVAYFVNLRLHTNFLYINGYILRDLSFLKFRIYLILFITLNVLSQILLYNLRKLFK